MSGTVPTVRVKNPDVDGGFMIINQSDFVAGEHEKFEEGTPADTSAVVVEGLPHGYALVTIPGGRRKLQLNGATMVYPDGTEKAGKDVVFPNEAAAVEAAQAHAASGAAPPTADAPAATDGDTPPPTE